MDINEIINLIKKEANDLKSLPNTNTIERKKFKLFLDRNSNFIVKNQYEYKDFSNYHDEEFIKNSYRGLLKREADNQGLEFYLNLLRSGKKSKSEIISSIRFSKEGREKNVKLLGAKKRYLLSLMYKIPIFGYILKSISILGRLPSLIERLNRYDNLIYREKSFVEKKLLLIEKEFNIIYTNQDKLKSQIDKLKEELSSNISKIVSEQQIKTEQIDNIINTITINQDKLKEELSSNISKKADKDILNLYTQSINNAKDYIKISQNKIDSLVQEAKKRLPKKKFEEEELIKISKINNLKYDYFYLEFENRFRGSREEVKKRLNKYIKIINLQNYKKDSIKIVDLGAGRGEWLEVLSENGYKNSLGIDINSLMVSESKKLGLNIKQKDAINYLSKQEDNSITVVTGFHIVEHLPFDMLMKMLSESYRVLQKGGMVIFETPNPENLTVGSCNFYIDPTHKNPLPPQLLKYLLEYNKFNSVEINYLDNLQNIDFNSDYLNEFINNWVNISQDYAVIGFKK